MNRSKYSYPHNFIGLLLTIAFILSGMCQAPALTDSYFSWDNAPLSSASITRSSSIASLREFRTSDSWQSENTFDTTYTFSTIRGIKGTKKLYSGFLTFCCNIPCLVLHFSSYSWNPELPLFITSRKMILDYIHRQDGRKA